MGTFIYRRLPYPDVPFTLQDGRIIYQVTFQYENREGKRPRWTNTGAITLGEFPSIDDCYKVVAAKPGEIFTADFFRDDGRTETERHEYLNQLLEVGKIAAVGHVEGSTPKMTPEFDDAFYRIYEHASGFVNDSRNHDTGVQADETLDLYMVCPGEGFYTGSGVVYHPSLLPLSVFGRDWGAASFDEQRAEAKEAARQAEKMGKVRKVGTCSGGGRLNDLSGKIEPFCIEFTDPEAKAIFMKIAQDRYFDWLEKQPKNTV